MNYTKVNKNTLMANLRKFGAWEVALLPNNANPRSPWFSLHPTKFVHNNGEFLVDSNGSFSSMESHLGEFTHYNCNGELGKSIAFYDLGGNTSTWKHVQLDVLGNSKDGYEINQANYVGVSYELPNLLYLADDKVILDELQKAGVLHKGGCQVIFEWEGSQLMIYRKKNKEPWFTLEIQTKDSVQK